MGGMIEQLRSLGLDMPSEDQGPGLGGMLGQPQEPQEDPMVMFQRTMEENAPLIAASRNAALKTPREREQEIYKQKIQQMFGVKLGEKNPKWRSVMRTISEGMGALAGGANGTPTIRDKARRQAMEDYKLENEVLGKDSTATLARMGQAAQQANVTKIAQMKDATAKALNELRNSPLTPKGKQLLAKAELDRKMGNYADAGVALRLAQAEKTDAQTNDIGKTNDIRNAEFFGENKDKLGILGMVNAAKGVRIKNPGEGEYTTIPGRRWQAVVGPGGNLVDREMPTERIVKKPSGFSNLDEINRLFQTAGTPATTAGAPAQTTSPNGDTGKPVVSPSPARQTTNPNPAPAAPLLNRNPQPPEKENHGAFSATEQQLERNLERKGIVFGRDKQKAYEGVKEQTRGSRSVVGSLLGTMFTTDSEGVPVLESATGGTGIWNQLTGRRNGKVGGAITVANQSLRKVNDDYRKWVTGQGAGMPELKRLAERYPAIGERASMYEGPEYAVQKALAMHFMTSLQKYRLLQEEAAPNSLGSFFPEKEVGDRIDQVANLYKKMRDILPKTPSNQRSKVAAQYRGLIEKLSDPMALYADLYTQQFGDLKKAPRY